MRFSAARPRLALWRIEPSAAVVQLSGSGNDSKRRAAMNAEAVREWIRRQPFEPFEARLSNGQIFQVRHPELVAVGKQKMVFVNPETDAVAHISLIHVNSIQALQTA